MLRIEQLVERRFSLAEGPLWDVDEQRLYWVDIDGKAIYRSDAGGNGLERWAMPEKIGTMALREKGGAVVALRTGFHLFDFRTGALEPIGDPEPKPRRTRMNDGKVDRQGRFLAGSMDEGEKDPLGSLYRLDPDHRITKLEDGVAIANGPAWSPDGRKFYFSDSAARTIYAYDYDTQTGAISGRRTFACFVELRGFPDGATVDEEGCLWSAEVFGGRLIRFTPEGEIDRTVGMPTSTITSVMFGGADLDILYVTSLQPKPGSGLKEHEIGGVFAVHGLGVRGLPETRFRG